MSRNITKVVHEDPAYMFINRCAKIQEVIRREGEENFYVSFSGGRDSSILHALIDYAVPGNKIPRVYVNTGIEFVAMVKHVRKMAQKDGRIVMIKPNGRIIQKLQEEGYPFSRKYHSKLMNTYQRKGMMPGVKRYYERTHTRNTYNCSKSLMYQFEGWNGFRISDKCCLNQKEKPLTKWAKDNGKSININGLRAAEGGRRESAKCEAFNGNGKMRAFQPLAIVDDAFMDFCEEYMSVELCELYKPPYNFKRTGCKGCPFNMRLQQDLDTMKKYMPMEYRHCEYLWKPVYEEYRRIGYRLKPLPDQLTWEDIKP